MEIMRYFVVVVFLWFLYVLFILCFGHILIFCVAIFWFFTVKLFRCQLLFWQGDNNDNNQCYRKFVILFLNEIILLWTFRIPSLFCLYIRFYYYAPEYDRKQSYFNLIFFTLKLLITQKTFGMIVFGFNFHGSSLKDKMFFELNFFFLEFIEMCNIQ